METTILDMPEEAEENETTPARPQQTEIKRKAHYQGRIVKTMLAGAIVDIGLGTPGVVHISHMRKEPVNRVEDVVKVGDVVDVWVRRVDSKTGRIDLTMVKPLDLEWREITKGMTVKGKVTRVEKFGAFVDIGAERPGLVHISELSNDYVRDTLDVVREGDEVEVKVIQVNRRQKRIKLSMKGIEAEPPKTVRGKKTEEPEETPDIPVPTAMEIAMREAMDRTKEEESPQQRGSPQRKTSQELDHIISRTLEQKPSN